MKTLPAKTTAPAMKLQLVRTGIKAGLARTADSIRATAPVWRGPSVGRKG